MPEGKWLVLFDIDGTLLKGAGPHHREALLAGVKEVLGCSTDFNGMDTAGALDRDLIRRLSQRAHIPDAVVDQNLPAIEAASERRYLQSGSADLRPYLCPGVLALLTQLHAAGVILGVVTGNLQRIGWSKLERAGLRQYFSSSAFSQDGKSRAELAVVAAERALTLAGGDRFSGITLVGDHRNDVQAAHANGFRSIAVATGVLSVEELLAERPHLAVADLTGLSLANTLGS